MFASLNENGQLIMAEMEPGDVLTAVQAKLDDMNDRCKLHFFYIINMVYDCVCRCLRFVECLN